MNNGNSGSNFFSGGFQSFSFSYSNNNGQVQQFVQTTSQTPGQPPVVSSYSNNPNNIDNNNNNVNVNQPFNIFNGIPSLFSSFGAFIPISNNNFTPPQINYNNGSNNTVNEPEIEDITDFLEDSQENNIISKPSRIEEIEDQSTQNNNNDDISNNLNNYDYDDYIFEEDFADDVNNPNLNNPNLNHNDLRNHQNEEYEKSLAIDQEKERVEEEKLFRQAFRESFFSLQFDKKEISPDNTCDLLVQLPNGKRVKRSFHIYEDDWHEVKQWVCYEMAVDSSISDEQFMIDSEFELILNYPVTVLSAGENLNRKLADFTKEIGRKSLLFIRKN